MSDYLEKAKELLEQPGLEITQKGIDLARTYATVAIAETQVERNNIECFKLARLEDIAEQLEKMNNNSEFRLGIANKNIEQEPIRLCEGCGGQTRDNSYYCDKCIPF